MITIKLGQIVRDAVEQGARVGVPRAFKHARAGVPKAVERSIDQIVDQVVNEFYIALEEHGVELGDIEVGEGGGVPESETSSARHGRRARKRLNAVGLCACSSEVENPGPHLPSCPWSDPDYEGP